MNNFYATVECMLDPSLRGKCVAVGGSQEERHGIILAKNYAAKAYGVTTGEAVWQAKAKCRDLVVVPPHFSEYIKYSRLAREIYSRYTDRIEPFGMDECWLDLTGTERLFGDGKTAADRIREEIKYELGLTVSVGVSFNKIFAKLGSDMKKPDAVTVIGRDSFREKIWGLPASNLLGVGRSTEKTLRRYGIKTIGDVAQADTGFLKNVLKSHGETLWRFANGYDNSAVCDCGYIPPVKSIGHGITTARDLEKESEVWPVILELTQDIGHKLRENRLAACGVSVSIRNSDLITQERQSRLPLSTQSETVIAGEAFSLFKRTYGWDKSIRSVTVRAIDLTDENAPVQLDLFSDRERNDRLEKIDSVVDTLRQRFGEECIKNAVLLGINTVPPERSKGIKMPTGLTTVG